MKGFYKKLAFEITFTSIIVVALVLGVIFFGRNISASVETIKTARAEVLHRWVSLYSLATLLTDYNNKAKADMAVLEQVLPVKDQIFNLNKEFQALAVRAGVEQAFTFISETPPTATSLGMVAFQLNVTAKTHAALFQYVALLEQFKYLSKLDSFAVSNSGTKNTMTVRGTVYYRM